MFRSIFAVLFLISSSSVFAQLDSNSVTVTVSRNPNLQPDLVLFNINVFADSSATLSDILNAIQPTGLTASDLYSVRTTSISSSQIALSWSFSLTAPLSSLKDTNSTLSRLQNTISQGNKGLSLALSFSLQGTVFSKQLLQSQPCVVADLVSDARTKATAMASAVGRTLSSALAISGLATPAAQPAYSSSAIPQNCSITVKFSLLGS
jgi:hypothetical protein